MSFQITSSSKGITAINQTCKDGDKVLDAAYFNTMFGCDDCVITEVADPTPDEIATQVVATQTAQALAQKKAPILAQLADIDSKSIRALRTNDTVRMASLEAQAVALRVQLAAIV